MSELVASGAKLSCSCGLGLSTLSAPPRGAFHVSGVPLATTTDVLPGANILPFSQCTAAAVITQAALTGQPPLCIPKPAASWTILADGVTIAGLPVLTTDSVLPCGMGGLIRVQTLVSTRVTYSPPGIS